LPGRWLVVGLGNPGPEYEWTPHNAGFLAVDRFAERNSIRLHRKECLAIVGGGENLLVAKPQTFMNQSGGSVKLLLEKYGFRASEMLLVYGELAFEWGDMRMKPKGSAAGHNGVSSVIRSCGTDEFPRLRIGVQPGHPLPGGKDYLLSPLRRSQREELDKVLDRAAECIESLVAEGAEKAMARCNFRPDGRSSERAAPEAGDKGKQ
jgi:PTH1 family peptidyl-tRNA hydrolase